MKNIIFILLIIMSVTSCTGYPIYKNTIEKPVILHPQKPEEMVLKEVKVEVWNAPMLLSKAASIDETSPYGIVVMDFENWVNIINNNEEYKRYILQQDARLSYYRELFPEDK